MQASQHCCRPGKGRHACELDLLEECEWTPGKRTQELRKSKVFQGIAEESRLYVALWITRCPTVPDTTVAHSGTLRCEGYACLGFRSAFFKEQKQKGRGCGWGRRGFCSSRTFRQNAWKGFEASAVGPWPGHGQRQPAEWKDVGRCGRARRCGLIAATTSTESGPQSEGAERAGYYGKGGFCSS